MNLAFKRAIILALMIAPSVAHAQSNRTFVSGSGVDSGTCSISAPCRSFAYAVTQTAANGELVVKDGAGYGPVMITRSITIANDGVGTASISVPSKQSGIVIDAGANDSVHIRGIEIDGNGVGRFGILINSAGSVEILNTIVRHVTDSSNIGDGETPYQGDAGIAVNANASVVIANSVIGDSYVPGPKVQDFGIYIGSSSNVQIVNTIVSNVNTAGLYVDTVAAKIVIDGSRFVNMGGIGIETAAAGGTMAIARCSMSNDGYAGIASIGSGSTTIIRDSVVSNNYDGVVATAGNVLLSHTVVSGNTNAGLLRTGGQLVSYGDNNINFNGQDVSGTITKYTTE